MTKLTGQIGNLGTALYKTRYIFVFLTLISFWGQTPMWIGSWAQGINWLLIGVAQSVILSLMIGLPWLVVRILGWIGAALITTLSVVNVVAWWQWGFGLSNKMFIIILQTNSHEAFGFLSELWNCILIILHHPLFWTALIGTAILTLVIRWMGQHTYYALVGIVTIGSLICTARQVYICGIEEHGRKQISLILRTAVDLKTTLAVVPMTEAAKAEFSSHMPQVPQLVCEEVTDNLIFVIGESSSAKHWSVFGYALPTTAGLDAMSDSLLLFANTLPPAHTTAEVLSMVLTEKNSTTHTREWSDYVDVIRLVHTAGYKTSWFSNQEKCGIYTGCIPILADCADTCCYMNLFCDDDLEQTKPDGILLPALKQLMSDNIGTKQFAIFHTMGSHAPYKYHYPKDFARFAPEDYKGIRDTDRLSATQLKMISEYDNAIAYTDYFLTEMIKTFSQYEGRNLLIYFSDHSEEVYDIDDFFGHARRKPYVKVPMIIWASEAWRTANAELWGRLQGAINKPIATENTIHLFHSLLGIKSELYDETLDFSSAAYDEGRERYFDGKIYEE